MQTLLDEGLKEHREGRMAEAGAIYRQILTLDPKQADSHHLLGMIAFQSGDLDTAATMIREAIAINPNK